MKKVDGAIPGVLLLESTAIADERGAFTRLFCDSELASALQGRTVAQINHSITRRPGAVRGMHFQHPPHGEIKIVRCLRGRVHDVVVDLRRGSPTFLEWMSCELGPDRARALLIPEGCAHGFQVLEPDSELLYLHTAPYAPQAEGGVRFDDPRLAIEWPLAPVDISARDRNHPGISSDFPGIDA